MTYVNKECLTFPRNIFLSSNLLVRCDSCGREKAQLGITAERNFKKNGKHLCKSCIRKASSKVQAILKARNSNWTEERRALHGLIVKNSENYKQGILSRPKRVGKENLMYGKKHTLETRQKMSESRKGKIGENATAWKGGKLSLLSRIRVFIQVNYQWYTKSFERDAWVCQKCGLNKRLDVHHIKPLKQISIELLQGKSFETEDDKYLFLTKQPEIIDRELKNGITLCRKCHRQVHQNWGSHNPQTKESHE